VLIGVRNEPGELSALRGILNCIAASCALEAKCWGSKIMSYLGRLTFATTAILLIGGGIWANMVRTPLPEMRGLWVTQAMRGMAY
jgi:hypothetical protein